MAKKKGATGRILHDPVEDRLTPIYPLDLSRINTIDDMVRAMSQTAYTARQIGDAADVLEAMARDKDCFIVMTLSGALTVGKMGLVFCDLVESGIVKAIVSTGALMAHGLVEATGRSHFRYDPKMDDNELFSGRLQSRLRFFGARSKFGRGGSGGGPCAAELAGKRSGLQLEIESADWGISRDACEGARDIEIMHRA